MKSIPCVLQVGQLRHNLTTQPHTNELLNTATYLSNMTKKNGQMLFIPLATLGDREKTEMQIFIQHLQTTIDSNGVDITKLRIKRWYIFCYG